MPRLLNILVILLCLNNVLSAQNNAVNYDEEKVPEYALPEILVDNQGAPIQTVKDWERRREELVELFRTEMYGTIPSDHISVHFEIRKEINNQLDGQAKLKEVDLLISNGTDTIAVTLLLFTPQDQQNVPLFLGMNFYGNHTIHPSDQISISKNWVGNNASFHIFDHRADELSRGVRSNRWPIEYIIKSGYGLGVIYYGDVDPDFDDDFQNGIHRLIGNNERQNAEVGSWTSIAAWSWALSKALDYLQEDPDVNEDRVAVIGHSRLGKTALWAGVSDPRFALVVSNNSGCGGAALSKRAFGETIQAINERFPHWFSSKYKMYNGREQELPFDQHMLLALIAPRPLYVASAQRDTWADPRGEYLSIAYAGEVYDLHGYDRLDPRSMPEVNRPEWKGNTAYHIREGVHDITRFDWVQYIQFANQYLK